MDRRHRRYYLVSIDPCAYEMRMRYIKIAAPSRKMFSSEPYLANENRGYQMMISCLKSDSDALEYELRKAERNDYFCIWKEI